MVDVPAEPRGDEALLQVEAAGTCGTDLMTNKWEKFAHRMRPPPILCHELSGIVIKTGPETRRIHPGIRVRIESHLPCGNCYTCHRGWSHVCPNTLSQGIDFNSGFAPLVNLPERCLWQVPEGISNTADAKMSRSDADSSV
ncbi:alcohol dehydrogenase catalytic domain-containing protein [Acidocella sp.]|uniref:alcohol dehydrogenase catalytic domain-containing protein n=1 Tax=Acidocella sp. TaxID=50710 RepID=UPI0034510CD4